MFSSLERHMALHQDLAEHVNELIGTTTAAHYVGCLYWYIDVQPEAVRRVPAGYVAHPHVLLWLSSKEFPDVEAGKAYNPLEYGMTFRGFTHYVEGVLARNNAIVMAARIPDVPINV